MQMKVGFNGRRTALQRERPVNPERSRSSWVAALEASQQSFKSAGERPVYDSRVSELAPKKPPANAQAQRAAKLFVG